MIDIENVNFTYNQEQGKNREGALHDFSLKVQQGECILICGESGCGKTTVTRLINGLIPHYYEGQLSGKINICGQDNQDTPIERISRNVGSIFQNPRSQFFCVDTTSEIAFSCENQGIEEARILKRIDDVSRAMSIENLLGRNIFNLSGGEKQKIACAGVAASLPEIIVMDEPTSNLDLYAISDLAEIVKEWKKEKKTIVIAEHRLSWLNGICDRVIHMTDGRIKKEYSGAEFFSMSKECLNNKGLRDVRNELKDSYMTFPKGLHYIGDSRYEVNQESRRNAYTDIKCESDMHSKSSISLESFSYSYGKKKAFELCDMSIPMNSIVAVVGRNGAGKSTFSKCLCGLMKDFKGKTFIDEKKYSRKNIKKISYIVMQDVNHQLFAEDVEDEVSIGMPQENQDRVDEVLKKLELNELKECHPMSLSGGQKQRVAIASAILADKKIFVFDEPTSGLDYKKMKQTAQLFRSVQEGKIIFIVTHDMELIENCCDYVLRL